LITALAGGVGGARFLRGLAKILGPDELKIIVNTGDDEEFYGLHVSPDVDIITYTLAGVVDEERGWGFRGDTYNVQSTLEKLGCETWFKLGDRDLAVHIYRTWRMRNGAKLSEITKEIARALGVKHEIIPMSDEPVRTYIKTPEDTLPFQRYFVERKARDKVIGIEYRGAEKAKPAPGVVEAIMDADYVIVCPSNPFLSIGTILSINNIRKAIKETRAKKLAISPIIGGAAVKGPADKIMQSLGYEVSALGVAKIYKWFLDIMVLDERDRDLVSRIEELGMRAYCTDTLMKSEEDSIRLARFCLRILEEER